MAPRDPDTYRSYRRFWWLRPGVLLPAFFLILLAVPVLLWIHTYGSIAADVMFVITYLSLAFWFIHFMKGNLLEPHVKRHRGAVAQKQKEIVEHRRQERATIYAGEHRALREGVSTPVLAVWSLDPAKSGRHAFIEGFRLCRIDPAEKEFHLRIHVDGSWTSDVEGGQDRTVIGALKDFAYLFITDPDVRALGAFWELLIIVVYTIVEDGSLTGSPVAVLSFTGTRSTIEGWAAAAGKGPLPGDVIYRSGAEIEPHRTFRLY